MTPASSHADPHQKRDATADRPAAELLTIEEAARSVRSSYMSVWGWCRRGVLTRSGERLHLPCRRFGRSIRIDAADLREFGRRVAEADALGHQAEPTRKPRNPTSRQRAAAIARANQVLDEAGC